MSPRLVPVRFDDARAVALTDAMGAELLARYGDGGPSPAAAGDFDAPGTFLLAEVDGEAVACGGLRPYGPATGEVKRMYVAPAHRGRGHARTLLRALLDHARAQGMSRVLLETGTEQPEAMALYASEGFTPVPAYGHYAHDPRSRCFARDLA